MSLIQIIILALVQGLTEFIPVSSSAHLILAPLAVESWADQGPLIDIAAHLGTLFAVMLYFRTETGRLVVGGIDTLRLRDTPARRLFLFIAVATIPIVIVGGILYALDATEIMRSPLIIGLASIGFGILLWISDRPQGGDAAHATLDDEMTWKRTIAIGIAQAFAIIPGASRSGVTITAARWLGMSRPEAARYSMLMSIPTIIIFALAAGKDIASGEATAGAGAAVMTVILSFIAGYAAIYVFMKMTERMSFTPFVIYRLVLGAVLVGLAVL